MPSRQESLSALVSYRQRIEAATLANQHHDQRRAILVELLRDGFGLSVEEIELERNVKLARARGRIDLLYGPVAWEVKRDLALERDDLERELALYLEAEGAGTFGIGTDGLRFEVFRLEGEGRLRKVDSIDVESASTEAVLDWLDAYLFSVEGVDATGETIVGRFGLDSAVYQSAAAQLSSLWKRVRPEPAAEIKRGEWEQLLEVVYGEAVGDDNLWIRHTYLVAIARLMAYLATASHLPGQGEQLGLLTGELFEELGLENVVERDFFSWPADAAVAADSATLLAKLSSHLGQFALAGVDEDILKDLYENLVDPLERHFLGEFYTPDWLADLVLERAGFDADTRLLDPACGSGTFLFAAIRKLRQAGYEGTELIDLAVRNLNGLDIHPVAVTVSRANFVLALGDDLEQAREALTVPVYMADTLSQPEQGFGLVVNVEAPSSKLLPPPKGEPPWPGSFQLPTYREVDQSVAISTIVQLVDELSESSDQAAAQAGLVRKLREWKVRQEDVWSENLRLLHALREHGFDTIWSFLLSNAARPHELAQEPVDLVVGNPPWLTVMDIQGDEYRERVRSIAREFGLIQQGDPMANVSHLDTSTVFAVFCAHHFLAPDGRLAFVLPRSVMAGAKQHERFREGRIRFRYEPVEAIDLLGIEPLFRIPACVMIFDRR